MDPQSMFPPRWADAWLRSLLPLRDRETVSGDLLEEYRMNIRPKRSQGGADVWYLGQVSVFAWRIFAWALALTVIFVGCTVWDWFSPPAEFEQRAVMTTLITASFLLVIGASSALRAQSAVSGTVATFSALVLKAALSNVALAMIYANWHDPAVIQAIERSGGLAEVFALPWMVVVPGTAVGAFGAWLSMLGKGRPAR